MPHEVIMPKFGQQTETSTVIKWLKNEGDTVAKGDVLLEIDVQGARQVRERDPDALLVFVTAPSPGEQVNRLRTRGDSDEHIRERLEEARREQQEAAGLGAVTVVNDTLDRAVDEILSLINRARAAQRDQ